MSRTLSPSDLPGLWNGLLLTQLANRVIDPSCVAGQRPVGNSFRQRQQGLNNLIDALVLASRHEYTRPFGQGCSGDDESVQGDRAV